MFRVTPRTCSDAIALAQASVARVGNARRSEGGGYALRGPVLERDIKNRKFLNARNILVRQKVAGYELRGPTLARDIKNRKFFECPEYPGVSKGCELRVPVVAFLDRRRSFSEGDSDIPINPKSKTTSGCLCFIYFI
jgi:hypothetical protein